MAASPSESDSASGTSLDVQGGGSPDEGGSLDRRRFLGMAGLAAGAAVIRPRHVEAPRREGRAQNELPNLVLCMADDQGWGDVAYNGHPELVTPHFDAGAEAGLRFDRFYAGAPVCTPTRGSVMTGRHPNRFGCFQWGHPLDPRERVLPELLKSAGYVTGHFGKWHLGSVRSGSPVNPAASGFDEWISAPNFFDNDPTLSRRGRAEEFRGESSMVTVETALEFIRAQADGAQPFLAVVWFGSPHLPHRAVDRDREPYGHLDEELQHFYGEITGMDRAFGRLRQELRRLGVAENTLLWYCSDNGGLPEVGSTGGRANKGSIYEGGLRVPGFIEWPAVLGEGEVGSTDLPVSTLDILPTVLEAADVPVPDDRPVDGISVLDRLDGAEGARGSALPFWDYPEDGQGIPSKEWMQQLLRAQQSGDHLGDLDHLRLEDWKASRTYPEDTYPGHAAWLDWPWKLHRIENEQRDAQFELYQLEEDPDESENRIAQATRRADRMKEELAIWQRSVVQSLNGADYG